MKPEPAAPKALQTVESYSPVNTRSPKTVSPNRKDNWAVGQSRLKLQLSWDLGFGVSGEHDRVHGLFLGARACK